MATKQQPTHIDETIQNIIGETREFETQNGKIIFKKINNYDSAFAIQELEGDTYAAFNKNNHLAFQIVDEFDEEVIITQKLMNGAYKNLKEDVRPTYLTTIHEGKRAIMHNNEKEKGEVAYILNPNTF